jgi:hypothetical protein
MVLVFALSKLSDLFTTALVQQVEVQSRCLFGHGLILNSTGHNTFGITPFNGMPYLVAHNAQYYSLNNTCYIGIYNKVNRATNFCPEAQDILGSWECNTSDSSIEYAAGASIDDINHDLYNRGLLYDHIMSAETTLGQRFTHLVLWSNSADTDVAGTIWNVLASVQTNASPLDENEIMLPLSCSMSAPAAEKIAANMASRSTMSEWSLIFQGLMYDGSDTPIVTDPATELAMLLNTIIMVQGGNNVIISAPPLDEDQTQGCIAPATEVPSVVEALVLIATGLFILLTVVYLVYAWKLHNMEAEIRGATKHLPDGVVGWVVQAAKEHQIGKDEDFQCRIRKRELESWVVGLEGEDRRLRVFRHNDVREDIALRRLLNEPR